MVLFSISYLTLVPPSLSFDTPNNKFLYIKVGKVGKGDGKIQTLCAFGQGRRLFNEKKRKDWA